MPISTNDLRQMAIDTAQERSDAAQVFALLYVGDQLAELAGNVLLVQDQMSQLAVEVGGLSR